MIIYNLIKYCFCLFQGIFIWGGIAKIIENYRYVNLYINIRCLTLFSIINIYLIDTKEFVNVLFIITCMIFLFFIIYFYKGILKEKIFLIIIFFVILALGDSFSENLLKIFLIISIGKINFNEYYVKLYGFFLSKLIIFSIFKVMFRFIKRNKLNLYFKNYYTSIIISLISLVILIITKDIERITPGFYNKSIYFLIFYLSLLIINIFIYYIFFKMNYYYEKTEEYKVRHYKNKIIEKYYYDKEKKYSQNKKLKHDFKNHILCISILLKSNNIDSLKEYIESMNIEFLSNNILVESGNVIVDAILNEKFLRSKDLNINMKINAMVPQNIKIESIDLCSILSNIIDNAIEASIKIDDKSARKIKVKINLHKNYLLILVYNKVLYNPLINNEELKTTKKHSENHGVGIKIIKNIVKKYHGFIEYRCENNMFKARVLLKLKNK